MARETKEQKAERLAQEELDAAAALEKYYESVPKRLMEAQALANSLQVQTSVKLGPDGPIVHFEYESEKYKVHIDSTLTYETEEWELEHLESRLNELKKIISDEAERYSKAQLLWGNFTAEEKALIKEFYYSLR